MTSRSRLLLLVLGLLLIFGALFLLPDFHLLQGEMAVNSQAATSAYRVEDRASLPREQALDLYVEAPERLEGDLARALAEALSGNPFVGDVTIQEAPPVAAADSLLVVTVNEPQSSFWSPFYVRTDLTAEAAYASDGEVAWINEDIVVFESTEESAPMEVRIRATHQFEGSAYGLVSLPGSASYLAEKMAAQINSSLADSLAGQTALP